MFTGSQKVVVSTRRESMPSSVYQTYMSFHRSIMSQIITIPIVTRYNARDLWSKPKHFRITSPAQRVKRK